MKNFIMKQMLKTQMKNMPKDQQDLMLKMVDKNPELFQKMAEEIKAETDKGVEQMMATMKVARKYQDELIKLQQQ